MFREWIKLIKDCVWAVRYKRAVRKAKRLSALFNMTYMVILVGGKLKVVPRRNLKLLVSQRRFKRGVTIQDIDKAALYVAR